ncbi:MAG: type II secretion system major pseudopilin GspG [Verrucomicrobiae bacterium]|nr:type II secretion system major pseudopilin GspG [Verrucomicrobiae bacterium]MCP5521399.1 type II secretion system major pseudopilin GspG [Verrucomicrobiales bacterium]
MNVRAYRRTGLSLRRSAGFTLIEILLVIVIIMMLAAALVVFVLPQQQGAEKNTTRLLLQNTESALDTYRLNIGHYPTEDEGGLGALLVKPSFDNETLGERWQGPYVKRGTKLLDAWGNQLVYEPQDSSLAATDEPGALPYKLYSMGPDGQSDTEDDITLSTEEEGTLDSNTVLDQNP